MAMNKKRHTWKVQCESTQWIVQGMVQENNMEIRLSAC